MSWLTMEFIHEQRRDLPICMSPKQCKGATFIVTGSNIGLGLETARHLTSFGSHKVILAVRNLEAGEVAKTDIETTTKTKGIVEVWKLDLGNYDSVEAFAKKAKKLDRLDGLIENASIALDKWSTSEGHETTMMINVYGTFLLSVLLLPKLKESAMKFGISSHLVVLCSSLALSYEGSVEGLRNGGLKGLDDMTNAKMADRYAVSKLIQLWLGRELAQRYPISETGVIIDTLNPGLVKTGLTRRLGFTSRTFIGAARAMIARTAEMGSRTILYALSVGEEGHGQYLDNCKLSNLPFWMTSKAGEELQKKLWEELVEELERIEPGCVGKMV